MKKISILFIIVFLVFQPFLIISPIAYAHSDTFGNTSTYGTLLSIENVIQGEVFTITEAGNATNITTLLGCATSWTGKVKCAIYIHSNLTLVGATQEQTLGITTPTWYVFNFTTPYALVNATAYILVAWAEVQSGTLYIGANYVGGGFTGGHLQSIVYSGFPNPMVPTHVDYQYSIYCTYTVDDVVSPTPPTGGGASINLLDIPTRIGLVLNVSPTIGGLIASMFALACIVAVVAIFTDNLLILTAFLLMGMCTCVLLTWLPYFVLIFVVVIAAIMLAEKASHLITGSGDGVEK